jgi:hypothetical protein
MQKNRGGHLNSHCVVRSMTWAALSWQIAHEPDAVVSGRRVLSGSGQTECNCKT